MARRWWGPVNKFAHNARWPLAMHVRAAISVSSEWPNQAIRPFMTNMNF